MPAITVVLVLLGSAWIPAAARIGAPGIGGSPGVGDPMVVARGEGDAFRFDCRVGSFPTASVSAITFWEGTPTGEVSAAAAGTVTVDGDGYRVRRADGDDGVGAADIAVTTVAGAGAALGGDFAVAFGDGRSVEIGDWIRSPGGRLVGFRYSAGGDGVFVDVSVGRHVFRGRLLGGGLWPGDDATFGSLGSVDLVACPESAARGEFVLSNAGSGSAAFSFHLGPAGEPPDHPLPPACERFGVRLTRAATGEILHDGGLCGLVEGRAVMEGRLDPGEGLALLLESWIVDPVSAPDGSGGAVVELAATARWTALSDGAPEGPLQSQSWPVAFAAPVHAAPQPLGFVTYVAEDPPGGPVELDAVAREAVEPVFLPVWPASGSDLAASETVPSGLVCPVAGGSQFVDSFGVHRDPERRHRGVDMPADHGTPVLAIEPGVLARMESELGGKGLFLTTAAGRVYYYAHLSGYAEGAVAGALVPAGTPLGFVGTTGNAHSPHLHFGLKVEGTYVNPYPAAAAACLGSERQE